MEAKMSITGPAGRAAATARTAAITGLALLCAGMAFAQAPEAGSEPRERCFGVALAGENDGIGLEDDTAKSSVNYQGDAWSWVPRGTCQTLTLPVQPDGTPRRGAIRPLERDPG
jgi:uncharacterized membrane protein